MPPIPTAVVTDDGETLYTRADIEQGRQVWQSIGGQQLGSIWGHGSYVAPDWSADWLHREATAWLDVIARRETGACLRGTARRTAGRMLRARLQSADPRQHLRREDQHHHGLRRTAPPPWHGRRLTTSRCSATIRRLLELRKAYAMKNGTVTEAEHRHALTRLHLVVRLVRRHRAARQEHHLHQQLAARSAGRQHAAAATCSRGRCSACCS